MDNEKNGLIFFFFRNSESSFFILRILRLKTKFWPYSSSVANNRHYKSRNVFCTWDELTYTPRSLSVSPLRVLLAAVSPYFRAMFTSPLVESRLTEIRLEEVTPSVMETVIQFVYTGEAGLSLDTAEDLFVAANRLQVMPLQDLCSR